MNGTSTLEQVQLANDLAATDDVQVDYLTGTLHIEGDVLGNFAVQKLLSGSIIIDGDVLPVLNDPWQGHLYSILQINRMAPGSLFRCQNMERGSDCNDADECYRHAMVLGNGFTDAEREDPNNTQYGTIEIEKLSGVLTNDASHQALA